MAVNKWELFAHDADMGVRGYGPTLEIAFTMGATALTAILTHPDQVHPITEIKIVCEAPDIELLFVDWLNAIIYEMETRNMLFSAYKVQINNCKLTAIIIGETIDRNRHQPAVDVKGATYTALKVQQENGIWLAQCVIDV